MNQKSTASQKEKDFPEEWKVLFLWVEKDINISNLVAKVLIRVNELDASSKKILMRIFSEKIKKEVENILSLEIIDSKKYHT